ncbi:hypothetical protein BD410DRAFT_846382 [Rickenella mellea]|uniref:Uncharacterized protein n=1 Tax=Rickenella mellea TaxID=50990 RepID=A0A4Y7PF64_9AGAM|nr:hypothetical protein BD410DRAFT_846382 [Rickenella mellea]
MVLVGRPHDDSWMAEVADDAAAAIHEASSECAFTKAQTDHRRGRFPALAIGVSFGGGQRLPGNLANTAKNKSALERLLQRSSIKRLASFASSSLALFAPKLAQYYQLTMDSLFRSDPNLRRNFRNSFFPSSTFNLGPQVECLPHYDTANLSFGWCSITALGTFDPRLGGHIVFWELGLVIEFPPGSTIDTPSAIFKHGNVKIRKGEKRFSFTQYAAAGLFRWVANGMKSDKQLALSDPKRKREMDSQSSERWRKGLDMFSTLSELME